MKTIDEYQQGQQIIDQMIEQLAKARFPGVGLVYDGIFDVEQYARANPKLLFIGNEPNDTDARSIDDRYAYTDGETYNNDTYWGSMNWVAKTLLRGDNNPPKTDSLVRANHDPFFSTAFTTVSNFAGGGAVGMNGSRKELAEINKEILVKKINVYSPDVIIRLSHNDYDAAETLIWQCIDQGYGGMKYNPDSDVGQFDAEGKLTQPNNAASHAYICTDKTGRKILVIYAYHLSARNIGPKISQEGWVNSVVGAYGWFKGR
jgi:hypothetical protein